MPRGLSRIIFFGLVLSHIFSCKQEIIPPRNYSEEGVSKYINTNIGFWVDYKIDTYKYVMSQLDSTPTKTIHLGYYRELIVDTIRSFDTPYQYQIEIWHREDLSKNWMFYRNISIRPNSNEFQRVEGNLRFVKIQSPINTTTVWKGNKYIDTSIRSDYGDWDYRYYNLFSPFSVNNLTFDTTISVLQYQDTNAIEKTHFFEVYAQKIGMVYAEYHKVEKQNVLNTWNDPENGYIIKKTILDWKR